VLQIFGGKQSVRRQWTAQVHAFLAQTLQGWFDDVDFFMAQMTAFTGVGVEPTDQDARLGNAEFQLQVGVQDARHAFYTLGRDGIGNVAQRQVRGHQGDPQPACRQHHHHLFGVGQFGKEFGVAGKGDAGFVDHALVHWGGDHAGEVAVDAALPCASQGFQHERRIGLVQLPGNHVGLQRGVPHVQAASRRGHVGPVAWRHVQQIDGHTQLRGPLKEQVAAGNGNQGVWLGLRGDQQAQVWTNAGRLAGCHRETLGFH